MKLTRYKVLFKENTAEEDSQTTLTNLEPPFNVTNWGENEWQIKNSNGAIIRTLAKDAYTPEQIKQAIKKLEQQVKDACNKQKETEKQQKIDYENKPMIDLSGD